MFDCNYYRSYPDLSNFSDFQCWEHYKTWGHLEQRKFNPNICLESYLCRYSDLRGAFSKNHLDAFHHYQNYGIKEGRNAAPFPDANVCDYFWSEKGYGIINPEGTLRRITLSGFQYDGTGVTVGLIDTGLDDQNLISLNSNEQLDGIDNDGNGLIDDILGWDFFDFDNGIDDEYGHGNVVAQTLHQSAPGCKIAVAKANGGDGAGTLVALSQAIVYLCDRGVPVINISQSAPGGSSELFQAVNYAYSKGVILVCSAGNRGRFSEYPAALGLDFPNVISVGAVDATGEMWNQGWQSAIAPPQRNLNFVCAYGEDGGKSGTSIAAPRVTGLLARLFQIQKLPWQIVIDCLTRACK